MIFNSLRHYHRQATTVALGMAIGMAVITGALVTGDSVRTGLRTLVGIRLGNVDLSVSAGERYLTDSLTVRMSVSLGIPAAAVLQLQGSASAGGGKIRLPKVRVFGVDPDFTSVLGSGAFDAPVKDAEAIISDNLAERLGVKAGDEILVRINKPGPVPVDAPFVSDAGNIVTASLVVSLVAGKNLHGRFHLQNTQSAPFNIFISREYLQKLTGLEDRSNLILMAGSGKISVGQAEKALETCRSIEDAGLHLEKHPVSGEWVLRTPRVFFDAPVLRAIESTGINKTLWFSYFVNEFRSGSRSAPYSFVSTLPGSRVRPGEILINRWLADDLRAKQGDSVTLTYFTVGPLRNLTVEKAGFRIAGIPEMDDPGCDRLLMPEIPGLSDAGNCRDWETSIPIDLASIRDKDEEYWKAFRGTPKAFINPDQGAAMWQNRFGKYTQIRFQADNNASDIGRQILARLRPADTGILISEPAREGIAAASAGVDFSGLFLGLSFFLIAGGIILTILLIRLGLEGRLNQIGTLRALGWSEKKIRLMLLLENGLVAVAGSLLGIVLTIIYTLLIFKALNGVWNEIVLTDTLNPVFKPGTLVLGTAINIMVSALAAWIALNRFFRRKPVELLRRNHNGSSAMQKRLLDLFAAGSGILAIGMMVSGLFRIQTAGPVFFFSAGSLLLLSLILLFVRMFRYHIPVAGGALSRGSLGRSNIWRNPNRSLSVVLLFSIGIFLVVAIGANRKSTEGFVETDDHPSLLRPDGTGGFLFYMETTVPVPDNLNNPQVRAKYGLETPSEFVQMKKLEGDDASCLNLNRVNNPPLLGVPEGAFRNRFKFSSLINKNHQADPWEILEQKWPDGTMPAVADQTVIQWGMGKKIGDTLKYVSEKGDTVHIVLAGGLTNSIFQGNILIAEHNLTDHWPSVSGTNIMLVTADPTDNELVQSEIRNVFRDFGTDIKPASVKLAEFNSVENTYLSIFLVMGALAMFLGTIGLAVILVRSLQERRSELSLMRAVGFSRGKILCLVIREYSLLLVFGTLAGGLSSVVSVLPGLVNPAGEVSALFLICILTVLLLNGFLWIVMLGWNALRKPGILAGLRTE